MKPIIPFALLSAFIAIPASGQGTAVTTPVGYVSLGNKELGADALSAGSEITLSIPLLQPLEFTGTASAVTENSVTLNESLTAGEFDAPADAAPWMVEVGSGVGEGIFLPIVSNTEDTITVLTGAEVLSNVEANAVIRIRKAWTASNFLDPSALPDNVQLAIYDEQPSINNSASTLLIQFGGGWFDGSDGSPADNMVLYPGESFVLINDTPNDIPELVVSGEVPVVNSRVRIAKDGAGGQDTRFSYFSPVGEAVGEAGFDGLLSDNDQLFVFDNSSIGLNKSASSVLVNFGGDWFDGATGQPADDFELVGGEGYVLRRVDSAPTGDVVVTDEQSYIPSL